MNEKEINEYLDKCFAPIASLNSFSKMQVAAALVAKCYDERRKQLHKIMCRELTRDGKFMRNQLNERIDNINFDWQIDTEGGEE